MLLTIESGVKYKMIKYKRIIWLYFTYVLVELLTWFILTYRFTEKFNETTFFFAWSILSIIVTLMICFGSESGGNLIALGRVYDHNNSNYLDHEEKNRNKSFSTILFPFFIMVIPAIVNIVLYFIFDR